MGAAKNNPNALQQGTDPADLFSFKLNYNTLDGNVNAANKLYNGNIAETFWRTATDGGFVRNYGYKYDNLNRLKEANYQKSGQVTGMYNENLSYDKNGNIMNLSRYGDRDEQYLPIQIDNLGYNYATNSNKLLSVADNSNNTSGFKDGNTTGDDYVYDANGNMTVDKNKNITGIVYNHLNLPTKIIFPTGNIVYFYTASGQKVQKVVTENTTVTTTDYLGGYQYRKKTASEPVELQFFPTAEGYVKNTPVSGINTYSYVFNYTDHLGNTRLSYTKDAATGSLKILEESNYYPFGLMHKGYNNLVSTYNPAEKLLFNGKELQDELNLNVYDFGARMYDPSYVKTPTQDPLAEKFYSYSSYSFLNNNPIFFIDPTGMAAEAGQSGNYYDWDEKKYKNKDTGKQSTYEDAIASHSGENSSSSPTDWIKNNETGEVKWFDGTGQKAVDSANKHWGFFNSKGKTTNLGSSFFGTTGESNSDSYQIKNDQLRYLLSVSNKINKMAGVLQNQDILGSNLAFEYLKSTFFGVSFGKSSTSSSDLPGVIWDYGGANYVERKLPQTSFMSFLFKTLDIYLSSQKLGVGSDRAAHLRANEVNYFKTNTVNYITPATLFSINLHKF